jgi:selenocysteine-specific elongation factor
LPLAALTWRAGLSPPRVESIIESLVGAALAIPMGDLLVVPSLQHALATHVLDALAAHHTAEPLSEGLPREEVRERVLGSAAPVFAEFVLEELARAGRITGRDRLALAGRAIALSSDEQRVRNALEQTLRQAGLRPPEPARLHEATGAAPAVVERVLQLLVRQRVVVRLDGMPFHQDVLTGLKDEISAMKRTPDAPVEISVATFKDRYGVTRKHAIPLLEYLDRERVTRRVGETRIVL